MSEARLTLLPGKANPDPVDEIMMLLEALPVGMAALILWIVLLRSEHEEGMSPAARLWLFILIQQALHQDNGWAA